MARTRMSKAQRIVQAHLIMGEKEEKETGSSLFLNLHKEFANAATFRRSPAMSIAAGYIPTNMDILAYVCSMPNRRILKHIIKDAMFYWDGLDTTMRDFITIIGSILAILTLTVMPLIWPVGYIALRYSVLNGNTISCNICRYDKYDLSSFTHT